MTSIDVVAIELASGIPVVLQRVPRALSAQEAATTLAGATGRAANVVSDPFAPRSSIGVLDARGLSEDPLREWDTRRAELDRRDAPLVVLLDVASAAALLRAAPHLASWAGGVRLPAEKTVRPARDARELELGRRALCRAIEAVPNLERRHAGREIAVDLLSDRVFVEAPDCGPLSVAREHVDEGIAYVVRLGE